MTVSCCTQGYQGWTLALPADPAPPGSPAGVGSPAGMGSLVWSSALSPLLCCHPQHTVFLPQTMPGLATLVPHPCHPHALCSLLPSETSLAALASSHSAGDSSGQCHSRGTLSPGHCSRCGVGSRILGPHSCSFAGSSSHCQGRCRARVGTLGLAARLITPGHPPSRAAGPAAPMEGQVWGHKCSPTPHSWAAG